MLVDGQNVNEVASVSGTSIASLTTKEYNIEWYPTQTGNFRLFGQVVFTLDEDNTDDNTPLFDIDIQAEGSGFAYMGDKDSPYYYRMPFVYFWSTGVAQTIYLEEEIKTHGLITHVRYNVRSRGDVPSDTPLKLYMATTSKNVFNSNSDWIAYDEFTLVFEGSLDLRVSGQYEVLIELDRPFSYFGGNLVIMGHRPLDEFHDFYHNQNRFQTTELFNERRSLMVYRDVVEFDLNNLPAATHESNGSWTNKIVNVGLTFIVERFGSLAGIVSDDQGHPLSGVQLGIEGTNWAIYSNEEGYYIFDFLPVGEVVVTASRHGFDDFKSDIIIISLDHYETFDFSMVPILTVNVSGKVLASDTGSGLVGAQITLDGYGTFTGITTDADGTFTIPGVFVSNTYTLTIEKSGYFPYVNDSIEVGHTNLYLEDITLDERATRPINVVAVATDEEITLTWDEPSDGKVWMSHARSDNLNMGIGGETITYIGAHRFSENQIYSLGVAGSMLERVAFFVFQSANFTIQIYSGGTGFPLNPGELIYSEDLPQVRINSWNEITLQTPVFIPFTGELWIALRVTTQGQYPLSVEHGPQFDGFGNVIFWGDEWSTLYQLNPTLTYNWMIKGYAVEGGTMVNLSSAPFEPFVPYLCNSQFLRREENTDRTLSSIPMGSNEQIETNIAFNEANDIVPTTNLIINNTDRVLLGYNIYRADVNTIMDIETWESIERGVTQTTITDKGWGGLSQGVYRYIVQAVYSNDNLSLPAFSNIVAKDMTAKVTIRLESEEGEPINNAIIRLIHNHYLDPAYSHLFITYTNEVVLPEVWLGSYTLSITAPAFEPYSVSNLLIITNEFTHIAKLKASEVLLVEDFDGEVFPPLGWTMIDHDGDGHNWMRRSLQPHSGEFAAISLSFINPNIELTPNNWLITPAIPLPSDAEKIDLSFFIATQDIRHPAETYSVAISVNRPVVDDFDIIHTRTLDATHVEWFEEKLDLTSYAGNTVYIAFVHRTAVSQFIFKLDTIKMTYGKDVDEDDIVETPRLTSLHANFPNPFNPSTVISFQLSVSSCPFVQIEVFNIRGQRVRTLLDGSLEFGAGRHSVEWNGTDDGGRTVSSGVYFYRMSAGEYVSVRRMLLMK